MVTMLEPKCVLMHDANASIKGNFGKGIYAIEFNEKGTYCMTGGQDRAVRLWNPHKDGLLIKVYPTTHGYDIQDIAISSDNKNFVTCSSDKTIHYYDVATGELVRKFQDHQHCVNAVRINDPINSVIVSASYDQTVKIWDLRSRNAFRPIQTLKEAKDSVTSLILTDGQIIAGCVDGCIRTYDLRKGQVLCDDFEAPVTSLALAKDRKSLIANCLDSRVRFIDKEDGQLLNSYTGHVNRSFRIQGCLSKDNQFVFSGSEDGKIYKWNLMTGKVEQEWKAHDKAVAGVQYHKEEDMLISASHDGVAKAWTMASV